MSSPVKQVNIQRADGGIEGAHALWPTYCMQLPITLKEYVCAIGRTILEFWILDFFLHR